MAPVAAPLPVATILVDVGADLKEGELGQMCTIQCRKCFKWREVRRRANPADGAVVAIPLIQHWECSMLPGQTCETPQEAIEEGEVVTCNHRAVGPFSYPSLGLPVFDEALYLDWFHQVSAGSEIVALDTSYT